MSWFWCGNVIRFRYPCERDLRSWGCRLENLQTTLRTKDSTRLKTPVLQSCERECDYPQRASGSRCIYECDAREWRMSLRWQPASITAGGKLWAWRMAGAKRTESPSEIDPDVKTEARKSFEHIWPNSSVPVRTMGSFESDAGQRYRSPVSSSMCVKRTLFDNQNCSILQHAPHSLGIT